MRLGEGPPGPLSAVYNGGVNVLDTFRRPLRSLRVSVTDRCNLRCGYCMPEKEYTWLKRADLLSFEEIDRLVGVFGELGVDKLRLTGGEPLLRRDLEELVRLFARRGGIRDVALTTNAILLPEKARPLREAGLTRLTISLDSLDRGRFTRLAQRDELGRTLEGIRAAGEAGFEGTKINAVILRGENDDELAELIDFGRRHRIEVRFIEYMDVGGATRWTGEQVVSAEEMLERIRITAGPWTALPGRGSAPAQRFQLEDGTVFGVISSTTRPFCGSCDRSRLTADGLFFLCLYARQGLDLRAPLREGATDGELAALLRSTWSGRSDRGAEERLATQLRGTLADAEELRQDPHLEMHTRGG